MTTARRAVPGTMVRLGDTRYMSPGPEEITRLNRQPPGAVVLIVAQPGSCTALITSSGTIVWRSVYAGSFWACPRDKVFAADGDGRR